MPLTNSQQIFFQVKSDLDCLEKVLLKFEQMKTNWIHSNDWLQCQLALAEGFTNAVRHAHRDHPPETMIDIEIVLNPQEVKMRIWDWGEPFCLDQAPQSNNLFPPDQLQVGGRGIAILRQIADELSYTRLRDHRNCLLITKKLLSDEKTPD